MELLGIKLLGSSLLGHLIHCYHLLTPLSYWLLRCYHCAPIAILLPAIIRIRQPALMLWDRSNLPLALGLLYLHYLHYTPLPTPKSNPPLNNTLYPLCIIWHGTLSRQVTSSIHMLHEVPSLIISSVPQEIQHAWGNMLIQLLHNIQGADTPLKPGVVRGRRPLLH